MFSGSYHTTSPIKNWLRIIPRSYCFKKYRWSSALLAVSNTVIHFTSDVIVSHVFLFFRLLLFSIIVTALVLSGRSSTSEVTNQWACRSHVSSGGVFFSWIVTYSLVGYIFSCLLVFFLSSISSKSYSLKFTWGMLRFSQSCSLGVFFISTLCWCYFHFPHPF